MKNSFKEIKDTTHNVKESVEETLPISKPDTTLEKPVNFIDGIVKTTNGGKLNLRKHPNPTADILEQLDFESKCEINVAKSTDMYYYVTTAKNSGYCSKEFISIVKNY